MRPRSMFTAIPGNSDARSRLAQPTVNATGAQSKTLRSNRRPEQLPLFGRTGPSRLA